jgi:hypothetical protein
MVLVDYIGIFLHVAILLATYCTLINIVLLQNFEFCYRSEIQNGPTTGQKFCYTFSPIHFSDKNGSNSNNMYRQVTSLFVQIT